jgi:hypothetical protein
VIPARKTCGAYRYVVARSTDHVSWVIASRHRTAAAAARAVSRPGPGLPLDLGAEADPLDVGSTISDAIVIGKLDDGVWTDLSGTRSKRAPAWKLVADDWLEGVRPHPGELVRRMASWPEEAFRAKIHAWSRDVHFAPKAAILLQQVLAYRRHQVLLNSRFTWWYQLSKEYCFLDHVDEVAHSKAQPPTEFGVVLDGAWLDLTILRPSRPTGWQRIALDWITAVPIARDEIVRRLAKASEWTVQQLLFKARSADTTGGIDTLLADADALREEQQALSEARPTCWYHLLTECAVAELAGDVHDELDAAWAAIIDEQQGIRRGVGAPLDLDLLPKATAEESRLFMVARCDSGCPLPPATTICPTHGLWIGPRPLCRAHAAQAGRRWDVDARGPGGACDECLTQFSSRQRGSASSTPRSMTTAASSQSRPRKDLAHAVDNAARCPARTRSRRLHSRRRRLRVRPRGHPDRGSDGERSAASPRAARRHGHLGSARPRQLRRRGP